MTWSKVFTVNWRCHSIPVAAVIARPPMSRTSSSEPAPRSHLAWCVRQRHSSMGQHGYRLEIVRGFPDAGSIFSLFIYWNTLNASRGIHEDTFDSPTFATFNQLRPASFRTATAREIFRSRNLSTCAKVFVRLDMLKPLLTPGYVGTRMVLSRGKLATPLFFPDLLKLLPWTLSNPIPYQNI